MGHSGNGWPILNEKQLIAIKIDMNTCSLDVKMCVSNYTFFSQYHMSMYGSDMKIT